MNIHKQILSLLILSSFVILPACGQKGTPQSEETTEKTTTSEETSTTQVEEMQPIASEQVGTGDNMPADEDTTQEK
jgi:hypothetical protein